MVDTLIFNYLEREKNESQEQKKEGKTTWINNKRQKIKMTNIHLKQIKKIIFALGAIRINRT